MATIKNELLNFSIGSAGAAVNIICYSNFREAGFPDNKIKPTTSKLTAVGGI